MEKEDRGSSMLLIASLGRPLVEAGLFPETVMDCTVQGDKKKKKERLLRKIQGDWEVSPLGINPKSLIKILS